MSVSKLIPKTSLFREPFKKLSKAKILAKQNVNPTAASHPHVKLASLKSTSALSSILSLQVLSSSLNYRCVFKKFKYSK